MARRAVSLALAAAVIAVVVAGCTCSAAKQEEQNKDLARKAFSAVASGNLDALDALIATDYVRHCQATPGVGVASLKAFKEYLRQDREVVPDQQMTLSHLVAEGDLVAFWGTYSGTQTGPMGPFPATGKHFEVDFAGFHRVADGKIAETWVTWDNLAVLTQLGLAPPQPTAEAPAAGG
jgi:steroid delta-isomerase-like uncharacterized protein